ncbi:MAG: hypothetical protein M3Z21_01175 [Pseudomonadota bacterium]|nr:hypothetical protein [Pseudomonadota bacterium]
MDVAFLKFIRVTSQKKQKKGKSMQRCGFPQRFASAIGAASRHAKTR